MGSTVEQTVTRSGDLMAEGHSCAESVLMAVAAYHGVDNPLIPRMATGFGGGVARTGGICGAFTGGVLALGLLAGRDTPDTPVDETYVLVKRFVAAFEAACGALDCPTLCGCDLTTEAGRATFRAEGKFEVCQGFTRTATRLVLEVLAEA